MGNTKNDRGNKQWSGWRRAKTRRVEKQEQNLRAEKEWKETK